MISSIIEFSVRNRFIVILGVALTAMWGIYALKKTPIDAIPDLSENQVIVFTDWMGRSPQEIDDQITYPLSVNLQGLAGVKSIRSTSEFNFSMINIIFDESTDFYFARTRVLEKLDVAKTYLPADVTPYLAPDATALGQIFWYTVEGDGYSLDELRAVQDWYVRYQLYVPGVAEVAGVGGFIREYQIDVDPEKLRAYRITLGMITSAVSESNLSVGGKVYFDAKAEFLIRGVGWLRGIQDVGNIVVTERNGVPIYVKNLASVQMGPGYRRSLLEKNGREVVGGVVMMRYGENPLEVTHRIKERIEQLKYGLPAGVSIIPFYDRTSLIEGAIHTLKKTLTEELIIASLAILLILSHVRSAIVVCLSLPLSVLIAFILMYYLEIPSNIMSLSGIAISIGILVDASVVMVENATHELTRQFGDNRVKGNTTEIVVKSCRLVGKPIFFAILIMLISFLPVFVLSGQEGKMFRPLAFTKTFAMIGVAVLAITFVPAMIPLFIKGHLRREEENWIVRSFINIYKPVLTWLMNVPGVGLCFVGILFLLGSGLIGNRILFFLVLILNLFFGSVFFKKFRSQLIALGLLLITAFISWNLPKLGREFMPPLDEGSILDMPVTVPRVSIAEAGDDIRIRDAIMREFPEVDQVVGKVGRAETPTDPSGIDMVETIVTLIPKNHWLKRKMKFEDVSDETEKIYQMLVNNGYISERTSAEDKKNLINSTAMDGMMMFDRKMREFAMNELSRHRLKQSNLSPEERDNEWKKIIPELNRKLEDFGFQTMAKLLVEILIEHSKNETVLTKEINNKELSNVINGSIASFSPHVFLWHKTKSDIVKEMDTELQMPGWGNIWTQPIINRVDMLATGVRTMIGVKVYGPRIEDVREKQIKNGKEKIIVKEKGLQSVSNEIAEVLKQIRGAVDVFPDQVVGRSYLEIDVNREKAARYGMNVTDIQNTIEVAMGGKIITMTIEGRRRFPVRVRYARDFWQTEDVLKRVLVTGSIKDDTFRQVQIPISEVTDIRVVEGPSVIKSENGMLRSYVQLNVRDRDIVGFVEEAQQTVKEKVKLPEGFYIEWSGQFEHQVRARKTLEVVFPMVILIIFIILYLTFNDIRDALLIVLAVPGALAGGVIFQSLFGYNFSVAVWVGYIACFGMATQTGIVMLVYLHDSIRLRGGLSAMKSPDEIRQAVIEGAVHRLRPKLMTEGVAIVGLMPMLWATGVGSEVMRPMVAPVLGGLLVADEVIDLLIPVIFSWYQTRTWRKSNPSI